MSPETARMVGELLLVAVVGFLCWVIADSRATRRGNKALLDYARGAGDMLQSLGHSLPDPRPLADQIRDYLAAHQYTLTLAEKVGLARRPDGSRAFTFSMVKPQFLQAEDWPTMLLTQIRYQIHKDKSGQYFADIVHPLDPPGSQMLADVGPESRIRVHRNTGLER